MQVLTGNNVPLYFCMILHSKLGASFTGNSEEILAGWWISPSSGGRSMQIPPLTHPLSGAHSWHVSCDGPITKQTHWPTQEKLSSPPSPLAVWLYTIGLNIGIWKPVCSRCPRPRPKKFSGTFFLLFLNFVFSIMKAVKYSFKETWENTGEQRK